MLDAITVSSFAVVVALASFWLSYKTYRDNARMKSAEKRTEALKALHRTWAQIDMVLNRVRQAEDTKLRRDVESHFSGLAVTVTENLKRVTKDEITDAVLLEYLKAYAADVEERVSKIPPDLLDRLVAIRLATRGQVEQVRDELCEVIDTTNEFIDAVKALQWTGEGQAEVEAIKASVADRVAEVTAELSGRINEILASDVVGAPEVMACEEMLRSFATRMKDIRMSWELLMLH